MINLNYKENPDVYFDFRKCLDFLSEINEDDYEYPEDITLFHVYTEVRTDKELECIKSYLATQNLEKTKLIVWSDYCIEDNPMIQPYKEYLDLRIWNGVEEAKGTIIEDEIAKLTAKDDNHWLQSDLCRLLVLHKYGGVWIDMDIIFLRDFKCILDQEYMYQWGSATDVANEGACATVLSLKKESEFSCELLKELKVMPLGSSTIWGKDLFASLWRRGYRYTIFPSPFFDIEWLISKTELDFRKLLGHGFDKIDTEKDFLFLDSFAWHWHNSSNKNRTIEPGSKFDMLRDITNEKLINRGLSCLIKEH